MGNSTQFEFEGVERLSLGQFTEKAYLEYSMYVVLDRALPHIGDGLKPVQRRIVYAMSELGLSAASKHKKSARTVGDVIGKFHPHGDSACYEAMVLMAQDFSYRYPIIDGQGNWGSQDDPKSFAAMRYTEARLTAYARTLLQELGQGTTDWTPNFDGTLEEPTVLPARIPNLLLNGCSGIAVGMSTDVPPHNLSEIVAACVHLLEDPAASVEQLCEHVIGPDYPTEAEIISGHEEIVQIYRTGNGVLRMRARYERENGDVVVTALPFQVSGARILEQVAQQIQAKKLPMVEDLRDESDHEHPTRLVIVPRNNRIDVDALMSHLFATTDLERTYRVNMNVIGINGRPQVKNLRVLLQEWLEFRTSTIRRRLQWRLNKVEQRLHILDGLLVAYLNIDEVISIIRSEEEPKSALMARFELSDRQAEAILELKLRHLARLEEMKIRGEQDALQEERQTLGDLLGSDSRLRGLLREELQADAEVYGDVRRSPVVERPAARPLDHSALVPSEPVTVILSRNGWIRAAKGHDVEPERLGFKGGDGFKDAARGRSNQWVAVMDTTGRCYNLAAHGLPSARGQGEPLSATLNPPAGARYVSVLMGAGGDKFLLATDAGYGFVVDWGDLLTRSRSGKVVLTVPEGCRVLPAQRIADVQKDLIVAVSDAGYMLVVPAAVLPVMARGKGNKIMQIAADACRRGEDSMAHLAVMASGWTLVLHCGKQYKTLRFGDLESYLGERGRRGRKLPRGFQKVDRIEIQR